MNTNTLRKCTHDKRIEGQCSRCRKCLECCGRKAVQGSCAYRAESWSHDRAKRHEAGYEGYWRSVEAGRQKR